ncbi:hypothetical protein [Dokdonella soli]|uniref:OmpA-like domain-containing protein n=1 Tax=Dokdonella soli TaxID=529810 RepID=A0ABN1ID09_9GAMM
MTMSGFGKALDEPLDSGASTSHASGSPTAGTDAADDFERLRELLIGDERRALDAARTRITELENAQKDLPRRLPGAAIEALRGEQVTTRVADALSEPVAQALGTAVQKNRQSIVDALFPIIGPLIRKSIAEALRNLVADLNGAIESSFTLRGLKWRLEAWRGGVPYAQVVLKHRLAYRIDHVFLIERASGLVLLHESAPDITPLDADAIAGMLTALGDFVGDSVGQDGGGLESMSVGEHLVWVVQGPRANLACFMRGVPPAELRTLLEQRLEDIHARTAGTPDADLRAVGDTSAWHEQLQPPALLRDAEAARTPMQRAPSRWPLLFILLAMLVALTVFVARRERWEARIDALRARLVAHPGFVLTGIDEQAWRSVTVHGLVDPDAPSLAKVFDGAGLDPALPKLDVAGYLSTDDTAVARRAARLLAPPTGVRLTVKDGVLALDGHAPDAWITAAREHAGWIPGVVRTELTLSPDGDAAAAARAELERLVQALNTLDVPFGEDTQPAAGAQAVVDEIARSARQVAALASTAKVTLVLASVGSSDESGTDATNARVRAGRARWLAQALAERGVGAVEVPDAVIAEPIDLTRRSAHLRVTARRSVQ